MIETPSYLHFMMHHKHLVYATAVYLYVEGDNSVKVNLVFSKSRLASSGKGKGQSKKEIISQLKLLAVTIGVRAANFVARVNPLRGYYEHRFYMCTSMVENQ